MEFARGVIIDEFRYVSYLLASSIALEVAGFPKPGNVHRLRNFSDTIFEDFLITAVIVEHQVFRAIIRGCKLTKSFPIKVLIGDLIENTVRDSMRLSGGGNTCLGSTLILYPLAVASGYMICRGGDYSEVDIVVKNAREILYEYSTVLDTIHFYNAIRIANPSYIRKSDIVGELPSVWDNDYKEKLFSGSYRLWDILVYSSKSDIVCREIIEGYPRSIRNAEFLENRLKTHNNWNLAVIETYLNQLTQDLDTLILRKHGYNTAIQVSKRALEVLKLCLMNDNSCINAIKTFDNELAEKGINPGSSADIIVSSIALYALKKKNSILRAL